MLRKLLKYDMKYIGRVMPWLYLAALASSLVLSVTILWASKNENMTFLPVTLTFPFALLICAISVSGFIMLAVRIYKNLYSDEGYLTFTLPATAKQHILSKVLCGAIWEILSVIVAFVSAAVPIVTLCYALGADVSEDVVVYLIDFVLYNLRTLFDAHQIRFIILAVIVVLNIAATVFANAVLLLLAFSIGQFAKKSRVLASVGAYFGINIALSIVTSVIQTVLQSVVYDYAGNADIAYVLDSYIVMFSSTLIVYIVFYAVTYVSVKKIMNEKLNLI